MVFFIFFLKIKEIFDIILINMYTNISKISYLKVIGLKARLASF